MMTGRVTADREAILSLGVRDAEGVAREFEAVVDTGYNGFLILPDEAIAALGLLQYGQRVVTLGDGRDVLMVVYEATVLWDGQPRDVQVLATDGDAVIGMSLLYGYRVIIDVVDGGVVTVEPRP